MQVSLSEAAKMAGITRSTLYAHIKEKNISVIDAETKRPKIDVSELVRVYGDKVRPLSEIEAQNTAKKSNALDTPNNLAVEVAVLRERLKTSEVERDRERRQLSDQIENLQELLKKEQDVVSKVTAQLTDQRSSADKLASRDEEQSKKFASLETMVKDLAAKQTANEDRKRTWWPFNSSRKGSN